MGDTVRPHGQQGATGSNAFNFRGMYNQRYHQAPKGHLVTSPVFRVRLTVGSIEVTGEGSTAQAAKHSAATNALLKLKEMPMPNRTTTAASNPIKSTLNPASVPFVPSNAKTSSSSTPSTTPPTTVPPSSGTPAVSGSGSGSSSFSSSNSNSKLDHKESKSSSNNNSSSNSDNYSDLKSPISLVHENALKRNLTVKFEVARETGPPHMRTFITRCTVGDFVTEGEGNGKRTSKARAAELMLDKLRELPPLASCQTPNPKKKSSNASVAAKKKSKN